MASELEGKSTSRPPLLIGTTYTRWKIRMRSFICQYNYPAWEACQNQWTAPMTADDPPVKKRTVEWNEIEKVFSAANCMVLNAIFSRCDDHHTKLIQTCETAYDARNTLAQVCEGNITLVNYKISLVESKFENVRMEDTETIRQFNSRMMDIKNEEYNLNAPYYDATLVKKVLRSLPVRFKGVADAIQIAKNLETYPFGTLMTKFDIYESSQ
ncbi:uncharacterized protein [Rutidosis leptorrhynchoides]|uniref:uncharacterized protein n=1 Tax=Rutidosis leptorrhynchoides TaxID=125765 RepID=UPI003A99A57A